MTGHIYVAEFDQGTIKVGMSVDPRARLRTHALDAARFQISITRRWISLSHADAAASEKALIRWCAARASAAGGREWFSGLDFEEVMAHGRKLAGDSPLLPDLDGADPRGLIDYRGAAELFGLPDDKPIRDLVARGVIPHVQLSRAMQRVRIDALFAYVESGGQFAT